MSTINILKGNLLTCDHHMIVQQSNCITTVGKGLYPEIAAVYPYSDVYSERTTIFSTKHRATPLATDDTRDIPGTCKLSHPSTDSDGPIVAHLFGQYAVGRSKEKKALRVNYFKDALDDLTIKLTALDNVKTIAFPYKIGCGMGGGCWKVYCNMLNTWTKTLPEKYTIEVLQL
jgi:O-acetyl-ADP-ribose deacetylase (regulator of RNase III)